MDFTSFAVTFALCLGQTILESGGLLIDMLPRVILDSLSELTEEPLSSLLHLSTSPVPMLGPAHASLAAQGLGKIVDYLIFDDLWPVVAPPPQKNFADTVDFGICVVGHKLTFMGCLLLLWCATKWYLCCLSSRSLPLAVGCSKYPKAVKKFH